MQIDFNVDGATAEFRRSWVTGRAELVIEGRKELLQDPLYLGTHFELSLTRTWHVKFGDHEIQIEKIRPIWVAGFRPQLYRVLVDGKVVAEERGY